MNEQQLEEIESTRGKLPDILFISIDTMRADLWHFFRDNSLMPRLQDISNMSVNFLNVYAATGFTLPTHMSMFTGLSFYVHGVIYAERGPALLQNIPTIAQILKTHGYRTFGFYHNYFLRPRYGFAKGFDFYMDIGRGLTFAQRINDSISYLLSERSRLGYGDSPLFIFAHYMDLHSDFDKDMVGVENFLPYYSYFPYRKDIKVDRSEFCWKELCASRWLLEVVKKGIKLPKSTVVKMKRLYEAQAVYLDERLGDLFGYLNAEGLLDDMFVIITADHGEEFGEHGSFLHNRPYVENIHVPLLIKFPKNRWAGKVIEIPVGHEDILPTILDYLNITYDFPLKLDGESLIPWIESITPKRDVAILGHKKENLNFRSMIVYPYHLIIKDDGLVELFDLSSDRMEQNNLASDKSFKDLLDNLKKRLDLEISVKLEKRKKLLAVTEPQFLDELDRMEKRAIEALGYK